MNNARTISPSDPREASPSGGTGEALQVAVALIELGRIVAPKNRLQRQAYRRKLLNAAKRSPQDQWLVRQIMEQTAKLL